MLPQQAQELLQEKSRLLSTSNPTEAVAADSVQARLASILAEVSALPATNFFSQVKVHARRHPAEALRWFVLLDALALVWGYVVAWAVASLFSTFYLHRPFASVSVLNEGTRFLQFGLVSVGLMIWFWNSGHYRIRMPFWFETQKIVNAFSMALVVDGFLQFAAKEDFSRFWLMSGWAIACMGVVVARNLARRAMRRDGIWQLRTLLVGSGAMADETRTVLRSEPGLGYEIVMQVENLPLLLERAENSWEKLCARFSADYVVIALDGADLARAESSIAQLVREGIPFSVSPPLRNVPVLGMTPNYFFSHDVMLMTHTNNLEQPLPRFLKRSLDVVGSAMGLLFLGPLLLVLAAMIKSDGGPIFFYDRRIGLDAKPFNCLKFRSMVRDADKVLEAYLAKNPLRKAEWDKFHKLRDEDPRITKVGAFIRKWSIDEVPQLINVLRGDMSLVGPRPINASEQSGYREELSQYHRVRPGLTGLWQVSGRSNIDFPRRVQMDSWYVRNWSLWHDIAILFKTIPAVLKKTGAC